MENQGSNDRHLPTDGLDIKKNEGKQCVLVCLCLVDSLSANVLSLLLLLTSTDIRLQIS